ncbi:winged helix-turn-helix domain-containing protein [Salinimonas iocasae]|uniref:OmpR/PhoB-type domain-containing protein n=1 Tax=Salinimonas iocasae TaxID=2572577 RepID=A0A5B7YBP7_9ALTE|nr:helix-turn-helix domain-containing protein [Salinimonas iocasae]QCZ92626.1 hypothetical protein FBQ74_03690 [Salinimonas iocasae]
MEQKYIIAHNLTYIPKRGIIIYDGGKIELANLQRQILELFLSNNGAPVTKEALFELWPAQSIASEQQLATAISRLRKNFNQATGEPGVHFIKAVQNVGYEFIAHVQIVSNESTAEPDEPEHKSKASRLVQWLLLPIACVILTAIVSAFYFNKDLSEFTAGAAVGYVDSSNDKREPAFSSFSDEYAYGVKSDGDEYWHVLAFESSNAGSIEIIAPNADIREPVWIGKKQLLYVEKSAKSCELMQASLDYEQATYSSKPIISCNPASITIDIAYLKGDRILLAQIPPGNSQSQLYVYDYSTGELLSQRAPGKKGIGIYAVYTSPDGKFLTTLRTEDNFSTIVELYDSDNLYENLWRTDIDFTMFSIAMHNTYLVFKRDNGVFTGLKYHNLQLTPLITLTHPAYYPTYHPDGFAFIDGNFSASNLLMSGNKRMAPVNKPVTADESSANYLLAVHKNDIFYSSDRTGTNQIWKFDIDTDSHVQLTRAPLGVDALQMYISSDGSKCALIRRGRITLCDLTQKALTLGAQFEGRSPTFDSHSVLYIKEQDAQGVVYRMNPRTNEHHKVGLPPARRIANTEHGLFIQKQNIDGIWRVNDSDEERLIATNTTPLSFEWEIVGDSLYTQTTSDAQIKRFDIVTGDPLPVELNHQCNVVYGLAEDYCVRVARQRPKNRLMAISLDLNEQ